MIQKDRNFLIEVAKKYYFDGCSQQEIAKYYNISRPSVSNILKQCKEEKIVEIRIQESESSLVRALGERLKNIPEVIGVACGSEKADAISGAINGGLVNSIVTDENTALRILSRS